MHEQTTTISFLDKKLLGDIRNHLTLRTTEGIPAAREIDTSTHVVSALLILFNEAICKRQPIQRILDTLIEEIKPLDKFYKKAQADTQFLMSHKFNLVMPFCSNAEKKLDQALPFIWFLQQNLGQGKEIGDKNQLRDSIFEMATQLQIEKGNPLVITALASLYGHQLAQKIIRQEAIMISEEIWLSDAQIDMINIFLLPDIVSIYSKQIWAASNTPSSIAYTLTTSHAELNQFITLLGVFGAPLFSELGGAVPECEFGMDLVAAIFPEIENDREQMAALVKMLTT